MESISDCQELIRLDVSNFPASNLESDCKREIGLCGNDSETSQRSARFTLQVSPDVQPTSLFFATRCNLYVHYVRLLDYFGVRSKLSII